MSKYMLDDENNINDINPFVLEDFSLPGGIKQSGNFEDFSEIVQTTTPFEDKKSVYCNYGLCADDKNPNILNKCIHPRRNIDTGFTEMNKRKTRISIPMKRIPYIGFTLILITIVLFLLYARR